MADLPASVVDEAVRLTRLARDASEPNDAAAYRDDRDRLLQRYGYRARLRESDATLVCYPAAWVENATVRLEAIDDLDQAVERALDGVNEREAYEQVAAWNQSLIDRIAAEHGSVHAENAAAFGAFMANHYSTRMSAASEAEIREFLEEYYPRNAWPSEEQAEVVEESLRVVIEMAERPIPDILA